MWGFSWEILGVVCGSFSTTFKHSKWISNPQTSNSDPPLKINSPILLFNVSNRAYFAKTDVGLFLRDFGGRLRVFFDHFWTTEPKIRTPSKINSPILLFNVNNRAYFAKCRCGAFLQDFIGLLRKNFDHFLHFFWHFLKLRFDKF